MRDRTYITAISDKLPMITRADWVPGPKQGEWTYEDYAKLPDDGKRYEIVNGVLYMMPTPTGVHQDAIGRFSHYLLTYVEMTGLGKVRLGPFDVRLAPKDVVQPDVLVVLNANLEKVKENYILGAPDLVVEVTLPGTENYDRREKYDAYARARVPEYWIAYPPARTVEVLALEAGDYYPLGVFWRKAILPSRVIAELPVYVEQLFA